MFKEKVSTIISLLVLMCFSFFSAPISGYTAKATTCVPVNYEKPQSTLTISTSHSTSQANPNVTVDVETEVGVNESQTITSTIVTSTKPSVKIEFYSDSSTETNSEEVVSTNSTNSTKFTQRPPSPDTPTQITQPESTSDITTETPKAEPTFSTPYEYYKYRAENWVMKEVKNVEPITNLTAEEIDLIERLVECELRGNDEDRYYGKLAIANVILNR